MLRLRAKVVLQTKIDHGSRGHLDSDIPKGRCEVGHAVHDALFDAVGGDVYEAVGIIVPNH